jgi:hypothetical protein
MLLVQRSLSLLALISGLLFQSCAHYQAGSGVSIPFSTIQISPVVNQSLAPQINQVINHDLRQAFIQSPDVVVESSGANARLNVTVNNYTRETIATNSQDTGLARKYALTLSATCDLTNQMDDTPYFTNRPVSVYLDVFLDSGQTQAETNAIPLLSKKLSTAIANEVLQVW